MKYECEKGGGGGGEKETRIEQGRERLRGKKR